MLSASKIQSFTLNAGRFFRGEPIDRRKDRHRKTIQLPDDTESILDSMYGTEPQLGTGGERFSIDDSTRIRRRQGEMLYRLYKEVAPKLSIEIGLAYGFSTVYLLTALRELGKGHHIAIDPFQTEYWHGIGAHKAEELGMASQFTMIEDFGEHALPRIAQQGQRAGFIFIDGDHKFDGIMADFKLSDHVLEVGGVVVFDDMKLPATRRVVRFVETNRADYERLPSIEPNAAVFRKISETDERPWNHYVRF